MNRLLVLLLFFQLTASSQIPQGFPVLNKSDLPQAKFLNGRHFTGESLFGYMDGGAELYREYGITDAVITELELNKSSYKCEVFKMTGAAEAFGIFSVSKFRCLSYPDLSPYSCQTRYQLQLCKGSYYISIINKSGNTTDSLNMYRIGEILAGKINEQTINLNIYIPDIEPAVIQKNAVLVKGRLGLANGAPDWEDYFRDIWGYSAVILPGGNTTLISVLFTSSEELRHFLSMHGWSECDLSVSEIKISEGTWARIIGENHIIIRIE